MKKLAKGFTLIELMIVVAIIGILAAIAIPNFVKFQCRSKQSEAKGNLKSIYVAEEAYRADQSTYSTNQLSIGFVTKGTPRYTYNINAANTTSFQATAGGSTGTDMASEVWSLNQENAIVNTANMCS